jgi:DNA adenine methylase
MNVINFYKVLKSKGQELEQKIKETLHSRETYRKALFIYDCPRLFNDDSVTRAWAFYVVTNQGFLNKIGSRGYDRERRSSVVFKNKVDMFGMDLMDRLRHTQIEQNDAYKVILSRDRADAFIYADPPYIGTNQ